MDGILLVDKPEGWTSHDVVAKVRGIIKAETGQKVKIGHTGTLDPMATGLMILVLGKYTKRAGEFSKLDKTYEVELTLGQESTTADNEGELTQISDKQPSLEEIGDVLKSFKGQISQTPPIYSAIKVAGQRAYKLARAGKDVQIEPRQVIIHSITNIEYKYPLVSFVTEVSSGTYIRSLAVNIGQKLGTGAYTSALKRTKIANYSLTEAIELDPMDAKIIQSDIQHL